MQMFPMFDMLYVDTFYLFICQGRTCAPLVLSLQNVGTNNSLTPSQTFASQVRCDQDEGHGQVGESPVYFRPNNQCDINLAIKIVTDVIDQTDDAQNMIDNS